MNYYVFDMEEETVRKITIITLAIVMLTVSVYAQNKVIVVPMGGVKTDPNLVSENIKDGVTILEVQGTYPLAQTAATGQTTSYATGDDGDKQIGATVSGNRFTDNGNGTVTDNLTGLVWLKNANCFGTRIWATALSDCNGLANGSCGLTDSSSAGNWRLPNVKELQSLIDFTYSNPALSNVSGTAQWSEGSAFSSVQSSSYWSSSTNVSSAASAWNVSLNNGTVGINDKVNTPTYVWPVRN